MSHICSHFGKINEYRRSGERGGGTSTRGFTEDGGSKRLIEVGYLHLKNEAGISGVSLGEVHVKEMYRYLQ